MSVNKDPSKNKIVKKAVVAKGDAKGKRVQDIILKNKRLGKTKTAVNVAPEVNMGIGPSERQSLNKYTRS